MGDILNKSALLRLEILQNQLVILGAVVGIVVILIAVLLLTLRRSKRRKSNKCAIRMADKTVNINLANSKEPSDKETQESYERIGERIKRAGKKYKSILFASVGAESLPVTIPVNAAVGLAKDDKRCFLIDLDLKRDAIAEAFGLYGDGNSPRAGAVQTEFEKTLEI